MHGWIEIVNMYLLVAHRAQIDNQSAALWVEQCEHVAVPSQIGLRTCFTVSEAVLSTRNVKHTTLEDWMQ